MIASILLVLLFAPAWTLAQETEEPSLVEAARQERERRAGITEEVQVLTNRDVEEMEGLVSTAVAPEPAAEAVEEGEAEESSWGALFDETRLDLQTAENTVQVLQLQLEYLRDQWLRPPFGITQERIAQQLDETRKGLGVSRQEVEAARAAYQELQKKAEAAGLLVGEIRILMGEDS